MILQVFVLIGVFLGGKPAEVSALSQTFPSVEACQTAAADAVKQLQNQPIDGLLAASLCCIAVNLEMSPAPKALPATPADAKTP
jgi:hypothetical protein